jgi:hypothetical protein
MPPSPDKALAVLTALEKIDGPMGKSKKFVAFMFIQAAWTVLLMYSVYEGMSDAVLMAEIGAASAAQNMFLGAQAWHDKHVKSAKATALNGSVTKAISVVRPEDGD